MYHRAVSLIGGRAALEHRRVAIFGAGVEGRGMAALISRSCDELVIVDDAPDRGPEVLRPSVLTERRFDFVIRSPGVRPDDGRIEAARSLGAVVTSASALFLEDFVGRTVVGVTGSKGKTTTALLTAAVLGSYGLDVALAGNIGRPVTELYADDHHDVFVVELSSYQTADVTVSPSVGVLTLLAPDHLTFHGSLERYYGDKLNLFAHHPGLPLAVNACSQEARRRTATNSGRVLYGCDGAVTTSGGALTIAGIGEIDLAGFQLRGDHNLANACGAVTAARLVTGAPGEPGALGEALASVAPPRSRLEPVASVGRVTFVDDALASNPEGAMAALRAYNGEEVVLIAGGGERGVDFGPLADLIGSLEPPPLVLALGAAGHSIAGALRSRQPHVACREIDSLELAVAEAWAELSVSGSKRSEDEAVVLFSPGAPTPAEEGSYLDRSRRLRDAVSLLASSYGPGGRDLARSDATSAPDAAPPEPLSPKAPRPEAAR